MTENIWNELKGKCPWRIQVYNALKNEDGENIWHECRATESPCKADDCAICHFLKIDQQNSKQEEAA